MRCHGKTAVSAGLGAAGRRIGPDIRRDWIQKPGRERKRTLLRSLLSAHGRCRRVGHRETTRMTLHAAACCPGYCPRPFPALRAIPAITSLPRSQAHETLGTMTTIIMRTSHDNPSQLFLALFQGFRFLGNLPITLVSPRGTHRHPRIISTDSHPTGRPPSAGTLVSRGVGDLVRLKRRASR